MKGRGAMGEGVASLVRPLNSEPLTGVPRSCKEPPPQSPLWTPDEGCVQADSSRDPVRVGGRAYGAVLVHLSGTGPADLLSSGDKTGRLTPCCNPFGRALANVTQKLTLNSGARVHMCPIV